MKRKLLFVVAADLKVGLGHYKRSHYLALEFFKNNWDIEFALITKKMPKNININFKYLHFINISEFLLSSKIHTRNKQFDLIITDIIYIKIFEDKTCLPSIFEKLKELDSNICAIDAMGEFSLISRNLIKNIDFLIRPYFCDEKNYLPLPNKLFLQGGEFIILPEIYQDRVQKKIYKKGDKVLITCGGSDPNLFTTEIIKSLDLLKSSISIRVIIGPLFSTLNREAINLQAKKSIHQIKLIENEESLYQHFLWSDLVISSSGLTKYEIAATGTPALLFSIDKDNFEINKYFSDKGICKDHGIGIDKQKMYSQVKKILNSEYIRKKLSHKSFDLIDGNGCIRIVRRLTEIIK